MEASSETSKALKQQELIKELGKATDNLNEALDSQEEEKEPEPEKKVLYLRKQYGIWDS